MAQALYRFHATTAQNGDCCWQSSDGLTTRTPQWFVGLARIKILMVSLSLMAFIIIDVKKIQFIYFVNMGRLKANKRFPISFRIWFSRELKLTSFAVTFNIFIQKQLFTWYLKDVLKFKRYVVSPPCLHIFWRRF